jgi:hypothetical protein
MELVGGDIKCPGPLLLPWKETWVVPIGDVQLGSSGVDIRLLKQTVSEALSWAKITGNEVRFIGMGDYVDVASPSNRAEIRGARLYDSVQNMMDESACRMEEQFIGLMKKTAGMWIGLLHGHHYWDHEDGTTSDTRIARALGAPYLGTCAMAKLLFRDEAKHHLTCTIWAHHGCNGGGVFPTTPINKLYHIMQSFDADVYFLGHMSKRPVVKMQRLHMSENPPYRLQMREKVLAGTGAYVQGYEQGSRDLKGLPRGSYVELGMMTPTSLGGVTVKIKPTHKSDGRERKLEYAVEI